MKKYQLFIVFLTHVYCEREEQRAPVSVDELAGKRFEFGIFENVEGCRQLYQQEENLVSNLKDIRQKLVTVKTSLLTLADDDNLENVLNQLAQLTKALKNGHLKPPIVTTKQDYQDAIKGMFTLFYTYHFNLTESILSGQFIDNAIGTVGSFASFEKLTLVDAESLLDFAIERKIYSSGAQIASHMMAVIKTLGLSQNGKMMKRLEAKKKHIIKMNNGYLKRGKSLLDRNYEILPYMIGDDLKAKSKQPDFVLTGQANRIEFRSTDRQMDWLMLGVCRKGSLFPTALDHLTFVNAKCRYLHHMNPFLKLCPFKEEQVSEQPYAVIYHDILSDFEIDQVIEIAKPNLSKEREFDADNSGVTELHQKNNVVKVVHQTVKTWISEVDYKNQTKMLLWKIAAKIKLATQLETQRHLSSTMMQITHYGLAGLCESHIDPTGLQEAMEEDQALPDHKQDLYLNGDILGTFMAWLCDTEAGGATVFLEPGYETIIMPQKGAALFWYDMDSSLFRDSRSCHAGCPIIKGSKWILNKWMHAYDNFVQFPCKLEFRARFDPPIKSHYF